MPSWFDIRGLDPHTEEDGAGIERAANAVKSLVDAEIATGVPADRIVIGGFSQGGATAVFSALTMDQEIAGVTLLSTWLPLHKRFPAAAKANLGTPILQCHGKADPIVPFQWGKMTSVALAAMNSKHRCVCNQSLCASGLINLTQKRLRNFSFLKTSSQNCFLFNIHVFLSAVLKNTQVWVIIRRTRRCGI